MRKWLPLGALLVSLVAAARADGELRGLAWSGANREMRAVVWIDAPNAPALPAPAKSVLDQRNLTFLPRVLVVRVGTVVEFPNNDRVFHNVFSFRDGRVFDLGMYPVGAVRVVRFDRPGLSRIFCNIHPQMAAYVLSVDTPYFAATDETGTFTIAGVPAGTYMYWAWRPGGPTLNGSFAPDTGKTLDVQWP